MYILGRQQKRVKSSISSVIHLATHLRPAVAGPLIATGLWVHTPVILKIDYLAPIFFGHFTVVSTHDFRTISLQSTPIIPKL